MSDTSYQIFECGQCYRVRITRLGALIQEAEGFATHSDAAAWVAQARRLGAVRAGQQKPVRTPYLRVID